MKKIIFIICVIFNMCYYSYAYTDIDSTHWAYNSVNKLTEQGILSGYPDGNFNPEDKMTIGEFLVVLIKIIGYDADVSITSPHWAQGYINSAINNNIVNIDEYTDFNPDELITRWEICRMLANCFDNTRNAKVNILESAFPDIPLQNYEKQRIATILKEVGILSGYPDGTVGFERTSTRAEISCFMNSLKNKVNKLKCYKDNVIYENNVVKSNICDDGILLRKYEFAADDEYCNTIITNIQMFEFNKADETSYNKAFEKILNSSRPYAEYRRKFGEGNYVIAVEFETINNTKDYQILTGCNFLNLFFDEEDIYIIDVFDDKEIDKQLNSEPYIGTMVKPGESLNTSAFYVLNRLPADKILVHRPLTTLYGLNMDNYYDVSSLHSAIIYIKTNY